MCKFKDKSLMHQYMKNKPIKWGFKFWFRFDLKSGYLYEFDMHLGKKDKTEFGLVRVCCFVSLRKSKRQPLLCVF